MKIHIKRNTTRDKENQKDITIRNNIQSIY